MSMLLLRAAITALPAMVAAAMAPPAPFPQREGNGIFEFRSGVIVDSDRAVSYLMNPYAGIDALDLNSGKILWTTNYAQKPLLLMGNTLVAHTDPGDRDGVLQLALLDIEQAGLCRTREDIGLPAGVRASIDDGLGANFRLEVWPAPSEAMMDRAAADDSTTDQATSAGAMPDGFMIAWTYGEQPIEGRETQAKDDLRSERRQEGAAWIDLRTGDVYAVDFRLKPEACAPPLPASLARLDEAGALPRPLWRAGDIFAAVVQVRRDGVARSVLKRWRAATGDSLADVPLDVLDYTVRYPSADHRHFLMSRRDKTSLDHVGYDWIVFSLASGGPVAKLKLGIPAAWFFVTGPLLVHEVQSQVQMNDGSAILEPRKLRALDLQTGEVKWVWALRDTAYRGSLPPQVPSPDDPKRSPGSSQSLPPSEGGRRP
jgi:hypothetical protein